MSILCGHCHGSHESVAQVRECSLLHPVAENATPEFPILPSPVPASQHAAKKYSEQDLELGFYKNAHGIFQVVQSKTSNYKYCKELVDGKFVYLKYGMTMVHADERMTLEEAKEYGTRTGRCVVCGAVLTNEVSVAEGIGPICGGRF